MSSAMTPSRTQSPGDATGGQPISIVGMHRSGTSMVARLLNLCGLYLGTPEELAFKDVHSLFHSLFIVGPIANVIEIWHDRRVKAKKAEAAGKAPETAPGLVGTLARS